jgi:hypothetical protein
MSAIFTCGARCGASVDAVAQRTALESEFQRRRLSLPARFDAPERKLWQPGYGAEARRSLLTAGRTIDDVLAIVRPFIDPVLDGSATGSWDPVEATWRSSSRGRRIDASPGGAER